MNAIPLSTDAAPCVGSHPRVIAKNAIETIPTQNGGSEPRNTTPEISADEVCTLSTQ